MAKLVWEWHEPDGKRRGRYVAEAFREAPSPKISYEIFQLRGGTYGDGTPVPPEKAAWWAAGYPDLDYSSNEHTVGGYETLTEAQAAAQTYEDKIAPKSDR